MDVLQPLVAPLRTALRNAWLLKATSEVGLITVAMNTHRRGLSIALSIWGMVVTLSSLTGAIAQDDDLSQHSTLTLQRATNSAQATQIALERFRFVHWYQSQMGDWPISQMIGDYEKNVMFPLGRSDRMYVLDQPGYLHGALIDCVFCYQRKDGKNKLVYRVNLEQKDRFVKKGRYATTKTRFTSLLDYLTQEWSGFSGTEERVVDQSVVGSKFAKCDLAIKRDYVEYDYEPTEDTLVVSQLSHSLSNDGAQDEEYFLDVDPLTNANLIQGKFYIQNGIRVSYNTINGEEKFYKIYGLPVDSKELDQFSE